MAAGLNQDTEEEPQRPLIVLQMIKQNCLESFVDLVGANEFF